MSAHSLHCCVIVVVLSVVHYDIVPDTCGRREKTQLL